MTHLQIAYRLSQSEAEGKPNTVRLTEKQPEGKRAISITITCKSLAHRNRLVDSLKLAGFKIY